MAYLEHAKQSGIKNLIENYKSEMLKQLAALVAIPSLPTYTTEDGIPMGPEIIHALHAALELSEQLGFKTHNEDDKFGWAEVGEEGPLVCIFVHLDIVPPVDGCLHDPYTMVEEDGWLYARGILDNKGPAIACLYALKACCDVTPSWPCRVRIYFGTNEETGMNDVQLYIKKYGAPDYAFVPDSQFPLSYSELGTSNFEVRSHYNPEKEVSDLKLSGVKLKEHPNGIPPIAEVWIDAANEGLAKEVCEKTAAFAKENGYDMHAETEGCKVHVTSNGTNAAHWNEPWTATNALSHLILCLHTLSLGAGADKLLAFVAEKVGNETDGDSLGLKVKTETAELSIATEELILDEQGLAVKFFMIVPAETRMELHFDAILRQLRMRGLDLTLRSFGPGFLLDKNAPLLKALYASYCEETGNSDPIKVCGGTYAKFVPGAVPFGAIFNDEKDICHVPNERIEVSDLMDWTRIYSNAILRIADLIETSK